jgi:PAS domain S-box-containing protein
MDLLQTCNSFPGLLEEIFADIQCGVVVANLEGQVLASAAYIETLTGYKPDELEFQELSVLFMPEDLKVLYHNILYMASNNRRFHGEIMLKRKDDTNCFVVLSSVPVRNQDTRQQFLVVAIQDITEQKNVERIAQDQRFEHLEVVTAELDREIQRRLVDIRNLAGDLSGQDKSNPPDEYRRINNRLTAIEKRMTRYEEFVRLPKPSLHRARIRETMEEVVAPFQEQMRDRNIIFTNSMEDEAILVDTRMVGRAFSAIIRNALEAVTQGGRITVSSENKDNWFKIYISDSGPGISAGNLKNLFKPFYSTKPGGVGLDLCLVTKIMDLHDGLVEVVSDEGEGATVILHFPWERRRYIRNWRLGEEQ